MNDILHTQDIRRSEKERKEKTGETGPEAAELKLRKISKGRIGICLQDGIFVRAFARALALAGRWDVLLCRADGGALMPPGEDLAALILDEENLPSVRDRFHGLILVLYEEGRFGEDARERDAETAEGLQKSRANAPFSASSCYAGLPEKLPDKKMHDLPHTQTPGVKEEGKRRADKEKNAGKIVFFPRYERISTLVSFLEEKENERTGRAGGIAAPSFSFASSAHGQKNFIRTVCVFAGRGGAGCSVIAETIGRLLYRKYGERALYLSLSTFRRMAHTDQIENTDIENGDAHAPAHAALSAPFHTAAEGIETLFAEKKEHREKKETLLFRRLCYCLQKKDLSLTPYIRAGEELDRIITPAVNFYCGQIDGAAVEKIRASAFQEGYTFLILDFGSYLDTERLRIVQGSDVSVGVNLNGDHVKGTFPAEMLCVQNRTKCPECDEEPGEEASTESARTFHIPACGALNRSSIDREFGFELERVVEHIALQCGIAGKAQP